LEAFLRANDMGRHVIDKRWPRQNAMKFDSFSIAGLYGLGGIRFWDN